VLEDNGRVVCEDSPDSQNVPRYVDARYCSGSLFPARWEGWQSLLIPYLENEVEAVTFKLCDIHYIPSIEDLVARTMVIRHKERRFGMGCLERWRSEEQALRDRVSQLLRPLDSILSFTPFLTGEEPIYADYLLFGILRNMTWNGWNELPDLAALVKSYRRLENYRASS
jgi:glutathione S-transferase